MPFQSAEKALDWPGLKGIILSGGPASVHQGGSPRAPDRVFTSGLPVLGICYGEQTMCAQLGGKVEAGQTREFGYAEVRAHGHTPLLKDIADFHTPEGHGMLKVWMSHGDKVTEMPPGFKLMASTPSCPIAGMANEAKGYYAFQFHPEVTHTLQGAAMITRFVREIAVTRLSSAWDTWEDRRVRLRRSARDAGMSPN